MLVFIDDSGDPGMKLSSGSSPSLVIACCVFTSNEAAERASAELRELKADLHMKAVEEFKFSKLHHDRRLRVLAVIARQDFFIRSIRINKATLQSEHLRNGPERFYKYAIRMVLSKSGEHVRSARVRLDGSGGREYKKALFSYLRTQSNKDIPGTVLDVKLVASDRDLLIQLADIVAGTVRAKYDRPGPEGQLYFNVLRPIFRDRRSSNWDFK